MCVCTQYFVLCGVQAHARAGGGGERAAPRGERGRARAALRGGRARPFRGRGGGEGMRDGARRDAQPRRERRRRQFHLAHRAPLAQRLQVLPTEQLSARGATPTLGCTLGCLLCLFAYRTIVDIVLLGTANVTLEVGKRLIKANKGFIFCKFHYLLLLQF